MLTCLPALHERIPCCIVLARVQQGRALSCFVSAFPTYLRILDGVLRFTPSTNVCSVSYQYKTNTHVRPTCQLSVELCPVQYLVHRDAVAILALRGKEIQPPRRTHRLGGSPAQQRSGPLAECPCRLHVAPAACRLHVEASASRTLLAECA